MHSSPSKTKNGSSTPRSIAIVKYNYEAQQTDELSLTKESHVVVLEKSSDGWWKGQMNENVGWFPSNYVIEQPLESNSPVDSNLSPINNNGNTPVNSVSNNTGKSGNGHTDHAQTILEVVVALYSFTSQNEEEMSFEKGERLEIINKPANDPDWWMARNKFGDSGLVPKNYVHVLSENKQGTNKRQVSMDKTSSNIKSQIWYYGAISRGACDQLLNEYAENGDFLIRDSETNVS